MEHPAYPVESPDSPRNRGLWGMQVALLLSALWLALAGTRGWGFGLVFVLCGALAGAMLAPVRCHRVNPLRLPGFIGFFLRESWRGGWDVARRALRRELPLERCWAHWPLRLPPGQPRTLMIGVVSLLPGTLSADLREDTLWVHSLAGDPCPGLAELEGRIARLFALDRDSHD
jgi:multicomponent Na+:H+ antiporter subunit E